MSLSKGKTTFFVVLAVLLFLIRIWVVFSIPPGHAPDEYGHLTIAAALSQGTLLTLKQESTLSHYPYATQNPMGYIPAAVMLALGSLVDPTLNSFKIPSDQSVTTKIVEYSFTTNFVARFGHLFWTLLYLFFLVLLVRNYSLSTGLFVSLILGLLPQIVFVQSYVNLDAAGIALFLYLIWGVQVRKLSHIGIATFFLLNCKQNYLSTLALPGITFLFWYRANLLLLIKNGMIYLGIPLLMSSAWILFNHYHSMVEYGGGSVLTLLSGSGTPARWSVFSEYFLMTTLRSCFGVFGYLTLNVTRWLYWVWQYGMLLPMLLIFIAYPFLWKRRDFFWFGALGVLILNLFAHYFVSFIAFYSPQGRYLFPAIIVLVFSVANGLDSVFLPWVRIRQGVTWACALFLTLSLIKSVHTMADPFLGVKKHVFHYSLISGSESKIYHLKDQAVLEQPFWLNKGPIYRVGVRLYFNTEHVLNDCMNVELLDPDEKSLFQQCVPLPRGRESQVLDVTLPSPVAVIPKQFYRLRLQHRRSSLSEQAIDAAQPIGVYLTSTVEHDREPARVANQDLSGTVLFQVLTECEKRVIRWWPFEVEDCSIHSKWNPL